MAVEPASVWFVRHAATEWTGRRWCGRSDPELSPEGEVVARSLAAEIAGELRPAAGRSGPRISILTSPLRRALQTAAAIRLAIGIRASVEIEEALLEVDFGVADGRTWNELEIEQPALAAELLAGRRPDWPGGETAAEVAARAHAAAERIDAVILLGPVVVVSHGGLLRELASIGAAAGNAPELEPGGVRHVAWRGARRSR